MPKVRWLEEEGIFFLNVNEFVSEPELREAGGMLHKYRWISRTKDGKTESGEKEIYILMPTWEPGIPTKATTFNCLCVLVNAWNVRGRGYCEEEGRTWTYIAIS